jgi:hypothetical protein
MTAKIDGTNGVLQSYDYQVSTTGFSYTFAAGTTNLVMNPAGTLATGTITMPAAPSDGMTITFSSSQAITALTVNANTGQSIVGAPTALLAGGSAIIIYRLSNTTWYTQVNTYQAPVSGGFSNMVVLTSTNASYSIPATKIKVTLVGGGGGSGGSDNSANSAGGGGGGGAVQIFSGLTIGNTLNVTVGASGTAGSSTGNGGSGGTTSVASGTQSITTVSATGGSGSNFNGNTIGTGGVGSGGLLNIKGGGALFGPGGLGGSSMFGAAGVSGTGSTNGAPGGAYGGGAGGTTGQSAGGSAGGAGVVIVEY